MCVANKHRLEADVWGVFRLYNYACNICGAVFGSISDADDHVKEAHFFPPLDY
ncbi:hypothetical protein IW143_002341 [Coemansia sp. RSA 520]|nr:hypothetical protein IW143_002341 [Coemansia sp. RSA 520]KAJ2422950.1 hypothetical protein IWW41_005115 [Coemansia sp. RSA 2522]KAJ2440011.1 hypothetical protein IWW46_004182 [Coemansia sp. RSA 2440]KAJ2715424.1 hypothetical protein H4S00_004849 [Coemansia sp. D1744]